ncbi:Hypothetical protein SRAE_2000504000 [Strongyloides ratti]|uniref:Uncharacterized protein n=1 Tax=Strongyloides ratti TaxID=34506 RepID=A0A090N0B7_STRRB|nr:Hypothetical protein SRAE_2000504000 [Strongyloides ratti]CEF70407.1 Hypothetical protein SRAE_2000504000 [Strongyloides ratti]
MSISSEISNEFGECEEEFEDTTIGSSILEDECSEEFGEIDDEDDDNNEDSFNSESDTKVTINLITPHKNEIALEETVSLCLINDEESIDDESIFDTEEDKSETLNEVLNSNTDNYKLINNNSDNNKENKEESKQLFSKYSILNTGSNECTNNQQNSKNLISNNIKTNESLNVNIDKREEDINEMNDEEANEEEEEEEEEDEEENVNCAKSSISTAIFNYIRWSKVSKIDEYDYVFQKNSDEEEEEEYDEEYDEEEEEEEEEDDDDDDEEIEEESLSPSFKEKLNKDLKIPHNINILEKIDKTLKNTLYNDNKCDYKIEMEAVDDDVKPNIDKRLSGNSKINPEKCNKNDNEVSLKNYTEKTVNDNIEVNNYKDTIDVSYTFPTSFFSNKTLNEINNDNECDIYDDYDDLRNSLKIENEILYELLFGWLIKKIKKLKQIEGEVDINYFKTLFGEKMKDIQKDYPNAYDKLYTICMEKIKSIIADEKY